jgi:acyl dehydratase
MEDPVAEPRTAAGEPAELTFEDFTPGRIFDLGTTVVDRDEMVAFARRFDPQPFHVDEEAAAASSIFKGLAASGWFTMGLWMRAYVDGILNRATSLASQGGDNISWPAPVFAGDELRASMEVVEARLSRSRPTMGLVKLRATLHRDDELVLSAVFTGMYGTRD